MVSFSHKWIAISFDFLNLEIPLIHPNSPSKNLNNVKETQRWSGNVVLQSQKIKQVEEEWNDTFSGKPT